MMHSCDLSSLISFFFYHQIFLLLFWVMPCNSKEVPNKLLLLLLFRPRWPKREVFIWKKFHETPLLKEVLLEEPYKFNPGTKERGTAWSHILDTLNKQEMKVTQRSVREKFDKLYQEFKERGKNEIMASGAEVEYDENHRSINRNS